VQGEIDRIAEEVQGQIQKGHKSVLRRCCNDLVELHVVVNAEKFVPPERCWAPARVVVAAHVGLRRWAAWATEATDVADRVDYVLRQALAWTGREVVAALKRGPRYDR